MMDGVIRHRIYHIGIFSLGQQIVATYEIEADSVEQAREQAWDLFIRDSYADEITEETKQ